MTFKPFQKLIVVGDYLSDLPRVFSLLQDSISRSLTPLLKDPFLDGHIIDVTLSVGTNVISHQLGREPQGYIVVSQSASGNVWQAPSTSPTLTLILQSSAAMNVSLRIF